MDAKTKADYENYLRNLASEKDMMETAKNEGEAVGRKKAEKELKPIIEQKEQALIESAKALLKANLFIEQVQKITKLPKGILEKLKENL